MVDEHLQPGTVIAGRYEVVKSLGSGSMGVVYACRHRDLSGHLVSVKVLFPEVAQDKTASARFRNEICASYGVSHPNVVRAYEYLTDGDLVAYTMEYVSGGDLADRLDMDSLISISDIVSILSQMCAGVQAIHDAGIIHRDLKPENILISKDGKVKITDFGIARVDHGPKLTEHGGVVGTIDYVSPEYMMHSQVDWRSDIYAIGILAYEMIVGEAPFRGDSVYATMTKRLKTDPTPPSVARNECPPELDAIVLKAMHREREQRYQSASEIFEDLRNRFPNWVNKTIGAVPAESQSSNSKSPSSLALEQDEQAKSHENLDQKQTATKTKIPVARPNSPALGKEGSKNTYSSSAKPSSQGVSVEDTFSSVNRASGQRDSKTPSNYEVDATIVVSSLPKFDRSSMGTTVVPTSNSGPYGATAGASRSYTPAQPQPPAGGKPSIPHIKSDSKGVFNTPKPEQPKSITIGGEDGSSRRESLKRLTDMATNVERAPWLDALIILVAVLLGVGLGFVVLKLYLPEIVPAKSASQEGEVKINGEEVKPKSIGNSNSLEKPAPQTKSVVIEKVVSQDKEVSNATAPDQAVVSSNRSGLLAEKVENNQPQAKQKSASKKNR
jgi:serine/threonine protein kinase